MPLHDKDINMPYTHEMDICRRMIPHSVCNYTEEGELDF